MLRTFDADLDNDTTRREYGAFDIYGRRRYTQSLEEQKDSPKRKIQKRHRLGSISVSAR